jgi:hypothetical protein
VLAIANKEFAGTGVDAEGTSDSVTITIPSGVTASQSLALKNLLHELGFSSAVLQRMSKTRALDGTQRAEGRNVNVSWTDHPDNGLGMVFEAEH